MIIRYVFVLLLLTAAPALAQMPASSGSLGTNAPSPVTESAATQQILPPPTTGLVASNGAQEGSPNAVPTLPNGAAVDPNAAAAAKVVTPEPPILAEAVANNEKATDATMTEQAEKKPELASLFFTPNQLGAIMRANQGFIAPSESYDPDNQQQKPVDLGPRILSLAGIVYNGPKDWTIWLNGTRVTPKNIPDRIVALSVSKDHVNLKWMDIGNQRVVSLTLRPNQRYMLDTDTIVMGTH